MTMATGTRPNTIVIANARAATITITASNGKESATDQIIRVDLAPFPVRGEGSSFLNEIRIGRKRLLPTAATMDVKSLGITRKR